MNTPRLPPIPKQQIQLEDKVFSKHSSDLDELDMVSGFPHDLGDDDFLCIGIFS